MGKQTEMNNEPNIHLDFYSLNAITRLPKELIPEVIIDLTPAYANPCILNILPPNSDSKTVCDHT